MYVWCHELQWSFERLVGIPYSIVSSMVSHNLLKLLTHLLACMPCLVGVIINHHWISRLCRSIGKQHNDWFKWIRSIPSHMWKLVIAPLGF